MGTKILEFHQTLRDRKFSYFGYFYPKVHVMALDFFKVVRGRKFESQIFGTEYRNFYEFLGLFSDNPG